MSRGWTHWATSDDLASLRMPAFDAGTGLVGRGLGTAQFGTTFVFDPIDAYQAGLVTNPNVIVSGSIGAGKSTVVKMMIDRALERGRRVVVVDPKGEYHSLAERRGVSAVALGRDGWCDPFPAGDHAARELLRALVASAQGSRLDADQHYVIDEVWSAMGATRSKRVLRTIFQLLEHHLASSEQTPERMLALTLYRFVHGDLAGLFDGADEPLSLAGRLVVLDLSAQWSSASFPVAALSAVAAAQRVVSSGDGPGYLVLDEAWALLADDAALRWLQGSWKLARARGLSHVLVLHRWTDVDSVGDEGSAQRERAKGLLRECESGWLFRQPVVEAREMAVALGLHDREARYLTAIPKGVALVRYGVNRSIVKVEPDQRDRTFIDTDAAMRGPA